MLEYIEREATQNEIKKLCEKYSLAYGEPYGGSAEALANVTNKVPTADVQEVRHGKWETIIDSDGQIEGWLHEECGRQVTSKDAYCPSCGVKMDKE